MESPIERGGYGHAKRSAKEYYSQIREVYCPKLRDIVIFNSSGFRHLEWKGNKQRTRKMQIERFSLLPCARRILSNPYVKKKYRQRRQVYKINRRGKKFTAIANVHFWALSGVINAKNIKVIVRQIGNGKKHFFSIFEKKKQKSARG